MSIEFKTAGNVEATRAEIVRNIRESIAAHAAAINDDSLILAWDHGLGVKFDEAGKAHVVSLLSATAMDPGKGDFAFPVVMNGNRECAKAVRRSLAIASYIPILCDLLKLTLGK